MISDYDFGINVLRYWWNASAISALGFRQFQDAIQYYDSNYPGFIEILGNTTRKLNIPKVKSALEKLGQEKSAIYPSRIDFTSAIQEAFGSLTFSDYSNIAKDAAIETINDIKKVSIFGLSSVFIVALALGVIWIWPKIQRS